MDGVLGISDIEALKPYCTDRQWEILEKAQTATSIASLARELGIRRQNIYKTKDAILQKAALAGYAPDYDMRHPVPSGYIVKGVSTLYDEDGNARLQWVKSNIDLEKQEEIFRESIAALTDPIERAKPTKGPKHTNKDLMACYPVGDHHLGMLCWHEETGEDYDLNIAETLMKNSMDYLVNALPPCEQAALVFLGDFMHYDSYETVTPTSKNSLDADGRFPKMVRAAIRTMRYMIEVAKERHKTVRVIIEIGNHDLASSIFLMECLSNVYENEPRVIVDSSPKQFHYFTFGNCLVGTNHGHKVKLDKLPIIMATDMPEEWGKTKYRYWWTGHVHHQQAKEYTGCRVESFSVLAADDAWAINSGYRSSNSMKAILLHRDYGEVVRHTLNPAMLS